MPKHKLVQLSSKDQDGLIERINTTNLTENDKEILTGLIEFNKRQVNHATTWHGG